MILLDEFEKCDRSVQRLFMSVFDEGSHHKSRKRYRLLKVHNNSHHQRRLYRKEQKHWIQLRQHIRNTTHKRPFRLFDVELINRFSQKYTFSEISRSVYRKIVEKRLASEIKVIKRLHPELNIDSLFSADVLAKAIDKITADTYNIKSGARPAITAVSKFIDSKLLSHFSRMAKTYRPNQN